MSKLTALKACILGCVMTVLFAVPAFATSHPTPGSVKDDVLSAATPYFTTLVGVVIALFGAALIVTLARKAAGMARGSIKKG